MKSIEIKNNLAINTKEIPEITYNEFFDECIEISKNKEVSHCVSYFGYPINNDNIKLIACIANDEKHSINVLSTIVKINSTINSLTLLNSTFEKYERELFENFGLKFSGHPWHKPVRYSYNRFDKSLTMNNYSFLKADSEELHEVGVGPIHAGIIEPGHFRFICNGETILHLEIQLGYQHRGIEQLMLSKKSLLERTIIAESVAGDSVIGHTTAFVNLWEKICNCPTSSALMHNRTLANEIERVAIHTGDLSAISNDIAYQLGSAVYGRLRTPIINFFQEWSGSRFAKGLIRAGKTNFPFTEYHKKRLIELINKYEPHFTEMSEQLITLPSVLSRLEKTGVVSKSIALNIAAVGMAARASGVNRDIRYSHPYCYYSNKIQHSPIIYESGDVYARTLLRIDEVKQSLNYIHQLINEIPHNQHNEEYLIPQPNTFVVSLTEGWRGEIVHCAITDSKGDLLAYKIKDPSFTNWMALSQAVKNNEISDFPLCNKSFNLSYCGHDL